MVGVDVACEIATLQPKRKGFMRAILKAVSQGYGMI